MGNWEIKSNNKKTCHIFDKKWENKEAVYQLHIDFRSDCNSVSEEILYNIVIGFGIGRIVIRLINLCLTETCSRFRVGNICLTGFLLKKTNKFYR